MKSLICLCLVPIFSGCVHRGKAKELHLTIGWPSVLAFEKNETGIALSEKGVLKAADSSTKFTLLLLTWESRAKDLELRFQP